MSTFQCWNFLQLTSTQINLFQEYPSFQEVPNMYFNYWRWLTRTASSACSASSLFPINSYWFPSSSGIKCRGEICPFVRSQIKMTTFILLLATLLSQRRHTFSCFPLNSFLWQPPYICAEHRRERLSAHFQHNYIRLKDCFDEARLGWKNNWKWKVNSIISNTNSILAWHLYHHNGVIHYSE